MTGLLGTTQTRRNVVPSPKYKYCYDIGLGFCHRVAPSVCHINVFVWCKEFPSELVLNGTIYRLVWLTERLRVEHHNRNAEPIP